VTLNIGILPDSLIVSQRFYCIVDSAKDLWQVWSATHRELFPAHGTQQFFKQHDTKECAKYDAEICQRQLQISADRLI